MSEEYNTVKIYSPADLIRDKKNQDNPTFNEKQLNTPTENNNKLSIPENFNNDCCFSKISKRKEFKIFLIIFLILIIISIFLICFLSEKNDEKDENQKTIQIEENVIKGNNGEILVAKLTYEINQCRIYNETIKIKTKVIFEEPLENGESEETIEKDTTINKYLVNIYEQKEMEDKSILYYAYILVLKVYNILNDDLNTINYLGNNIFNSSEYEITKNKKNKFIEEYITNLKEQEENYEEMFNDIKEELDYYTKSPLVKFSFFENGTIKQILKPKIIEPYLYSNIENFIWKSVPSISESLYSKKDSQRNLEENGIIREISKDKNSNITKLTELESTKVSFMNSNANSETNVKINNEGYISEINGFSVLETTSDINDQIEDIPVSSESPIQASDFDIEDQNLSKGPTKSITNIIDTQMLLEYNDINETVKDTIEKIINDENVEFEEIYKFNGNNINLKKRKVNHNFIHNDEKGNVKNAKEFKGNLNDYPDISKLRNLEIKSLSNPIMFSYSIFKSNLGGVKIGMSALISFFPSNGTSNIIILFNTNGQNKILFEKTEISNLGESLKLMDKVIDIVNKDLLRLNNNINSDNSKWVNKINKHLQTISQKIKTFNDLSKTFVQPLKDLISNIENSSKTSFDIIHKKINNTEIKLNKINNEILLNPIKDTNTIQIIEETKKEFNSYIKSKNDKIQSLHDEIINFIDGLSSSLSSLSESLDISVYYRIIEELELCTNIYNIFDENVIKNSISKEKESFNFFIEETLTIELNEILLKNEFIGKRLQTNETLKKSINENNRKDMISKLFSFREKINNIITNIQNNLNSTYNNLFNEVSLSSVSNYKNIFLSKKNNIIKELNNAATKSNNFLSHVNDLESISTINSNIFKKRNELFSKYMIKKLESVKIKYINENKLSFDKEITEISEKMKNEVSQNKENNFSNLKNLVDQFVLKIKDIDSKNMSDHLYANVFRLFNDTILIDSMYNNYYKELTPEFNQLNETFYQKIFKNNLKNYVKQPDEINFILNQMLSTQFTQKDYINKKVTSLIYTYVKLMISYRYYNYIDLINNYIDEINKNIPNENFENEALNNLNYFKSKSEELINFEKKQRNDFLIICDQSYTSHIDPLNILSITTSKENSYSRLIKQIIGYIKVDFENKFCEDVCEPLPVLDNNENYNYNNAILRYGINVLKSIFLESENIITHESIKEISSNKYLNEFISNSNYNKDQIISDILFFLNKITNEDSIMINPYIENNLNNIKSIIYKNINEEISNGKLNQLNDKVFILDSVTSKQINNLIINLKGKIDTIFIEEKKNLNNYYFNIELVQKNFEAEYKKLEEKLKKNSEIILNQIKYNDNYQKVIYNYYIKDKQKFINFLESTVSETTSIFSDIKILNKTFDLKKISLEQIKSISNILENTFNVNSKKIINTTFSNFINKILKEFLETKEKDILKKYNESYEVYYTNVSQGSEIEGNQFTLNITSFSTNLKNNLTKYINNFLNEISRILSNNYFNEFFNTNRDLNLKILDTLIYDIDSLNDILLENGMTFKNLCEDRYKKEKVLLNEQIYLIIKENYKNNINNFINSYSSIYFDSIYEETYIDRILYQLENIQVQLIDIQQFIIDTVNKVESVQEIIKETLDKYYEDIKMGYTNNLIQKTKDLLYSEIDKFNKESSELITKVFLDEIIKFINSETISINLGKQIIENIPKTLPVVFYKENSEFYLETQKQNIDNFKSKFLNDITQKGKEIEVIVNNGKNNINLLIDNKPEIYKDLETKSMELFVDDFIQNTNSLLQIDESEKNIKISEQKKNNFKLLLTNKIKVELNEIISAYDNSENDIREKITNNIGSFKDYSVETIQKLNVDLIIKDTEDSFSEIQNIKNEIITFINDKVNNISLNIEKDTYFTQNFEKYKNNLRRLSSIFNKNNKKRKLAQKEININQIKDIFPMIEDSLNKFSNKIILSNDFINFNSNKTTFLSKIKNSIEHLKDPIIPSLDLLKDYLTTDQYNSFELNLNAQSDKIIKELLKLYQQESKELTKISNYINNDYKQIYSEIYLIIKVIIDTLLLSYFDKIFKHMKKIEISEKKIKNDLVINSFSENMFGDITTFNSHITSYGYSYVMKLIYEDYQIKTNLEAGGYCNINAEHTVGDIKSTINGRLGDGKIGIKAIGDLTIGKIELTAYINQHQSSYDKIIEKYVQKTGRRIRRLCKRKKKKKAPEPTYYYVWEVIKSASVKTLSKLTNIFKYY